MTTTHVTHASLGRAAWQLVQVVCITALLPTLQGCSPQALLVRNAADALAGQSQVIEEDLPLAREASAFYLKLSESVLLQTPGHLPLAAAVAGGFTQYAYAFVGFDAERLASTDAKAALRLRERAARLYGRAHRHAMAALELHTPGLAISLAPADARAAARALTLSTDQVAVAYWAAASWGAHISLSKDRPDVVADFPRALRLARIAWEADPGHGNGALASLMGSFEMARPGGSAQQARTYFAQARAAGQGRSAAPLVAEAEDLSLPAGDRQGYEALLHQALDISRTHRNLGNEVMRERAQWLLDTADDRF